jgi:DNA-binding XRE family transcriptional regulator
MKYPEEVQGFGKRVRKLREEAGFSQQELADYADINKKTLQKIELGRIATNIEIVAALAKALNKRLSELFFTE